MISSTGVTCRLVEVGRMLLISRELSDRERPSIGHGSFYDGGLINCKREFRKRGSNRMYTYLTLQFLTANGWDALPELMLYVLISVCSVLETTPSS